MGLGAEDGGFLSWLNLRIWGFSDGFWVTKGRMGLGGNKADDGSWVLVWGVRRVGWECYVMEWGVKSLFWGVLSNGVCRDSQGVYIEPLLNECIL